MLREQLTESMKDAMRAKDSCRLKTIRLVLAAIKDGDIAMRTEEKSEKDDDAIILEILSKMVKQRHDSIKAYEEGGRVELADRERDEIEVIQEFLPRQMSEDEITAAVDTAIAELNASGLKDIGPTMGKLKSQYAGSMDFSKAAAKVRAALS